MKKNDLVYLGHMLDIAHEAVSNIGDKSREEYDADDKLRLALAHLVQTFGEAARRISPSFKERYAHIPWNRIIGMRHRIVHNYLSVNYNLVWDVVTAELPLLIDTLERIVLLEDN